MRTLLECSLTMTAVAALLLLLTPWLTRHYRARSVYIAWAIVLVGFLVPLRPQVAAPAVTVPVPSARVLYAPPTIPVNLPSVAQPAPANDVPAVEGQTGAMPDTPRFQLPALNTAELALAVWLIGAAAAFALRLLSHRRFLKSVRRWCRPVESAVTLDELAAAREALGIRRRVGLTRCPTVDSPMLIGLVRPRILLPDAALSPTELRLVLRHELIHLRRGDLWGRLLLMAGSSLHWFNPVMIPVGRAFSLACEEACDAEVMRGMDVDARQYYGRTILQSMRGKPGTATALSTRYRGGKKTMKRRLMRILDGRKKKVGTAAVSLLLVAVLGMGMAFALGTEGVPTDGPGRAKALNARLGELLFQASMLRTAVPEIESYVFAKDTFTEAEYTRLMAEMDACGNDPLEIWEQVKQFDLKVPEANAEVTAFADQVIAAAGLEGYDHRQFTYSRKFAMDVPSWTVEADDEPLYENAAPAIQMTTIGDDQLAAFQGPNVGHSDVTQQGLIAENAERELTAEERETVRARVAAFYNDYAYGEKSALETLMVSDYAFTEGGELYTYAWVFSFAHPGYFAVSTLPYDTENRENNHGYLFTIGLETDSIYTMSNYNRETTFVNRKQAQSEWAARTGLEYPYPDMDYINDTIAPQIREKLGDLMGRYGKTIGMEDRILATVLGTNTEHYLATKGPWRELLADLTACESEADFIAFLHTDYATINQAPDGEPTREEILAAAEPTIEALGYGDMPYRAFMYSGPLTGADPGDPGYTVWAIDAKEDDLSVWGYNYPQWPSNQYVQLAVSVDGKVRYVDTGYSYLPKGGKLTTGADKARVSEVVMNIVRNHLGFKDMAPVKDAPHVAEKTYTGIEGKRVVNAYILIDTKENAEAGGEPTALTMAVDAVSGQVANIALWGGVEGAEAYINGDY